VFEVVTEDLGPAYSALYDASVDLWNDLHGELGNMRDTILSKVRRRRRSSH
jgi:hypothetical protein